LNTQSPNTEIIFIAIL